MEAFSEANDATSFSTTSAALQKSLLHTSYPLLAAAANHTRQYRMSHAAPQNGQTIHPHPRTHSGRSSSAPSLTPHQPLHKTSPASHTTITLNHSQMREAHPPHSPPGWSHHNLGSHLHSTVAYTPHTHIKRPFLNNTIPQPITESPTHHTPLLKRTCLKLPTLELVFQKCTTNLNLNR